MDESSCSVSFKSIQNKAYITPVQLNLNSVFEPDPLLYRGLIADNYLPLEGHLPT
jgi:hypothetical protein